MPSGDVKYYIVLDKELLGREDLDLTEKIIYAYMTQNAECESKSRTIGFCANYLALSEDEVRRAWIRLVQLGMLGETF